VGVDVGAGVGVGLVQIDDMAQLHV